MNCLFTHSMRGGINKHEISSRSCGVGKQDKTCFSFGKQLVDARQGTYLQFLREKHKRRERGGGGLTTQIVNYCLLILLMGCMVCMLIVVYPVFLSDPN